MKYVMSDIHGHYDAWKEMLDIIQLKESDSLIVIGDVIDRGKDGVKILKEIMDAKNIKMLMGNHEFMMLSAATFDKAIYREEWMLNGGYPTVKAMCELPSSEQDSIIAFIKTLQVRATTKVSETRRYNLVHGWLVDESVKELEPYEFARGCVWERPKGRMDVPPVFKDRLYPLIIGHTPVQEFVSMDEWKAKGKEWCIVHAPNFIDIDCGCGHSGGRLACLRLDDFKEFYVSA